LISTTFELPKASIYYFYGFWSLFLISVHGSKFLVKTEHFKFYNVAIIKIKLFLFEGVWFVFAVAGGSIPCNL
jgi:hypothetical protein